MIIPSLFSCSKDDNTSEPEETNQVEEDNEEEQDNSFTPIGNIEVFDESKMDDNYILVNDAKANRVYLMNKEAKLLNEWNLSNNIGNDVILLPNGKLLAALESDEPKMPWGGKGGRIQTWRPWSALFMRGRVHRCHVLPAKQ